MKRVKQNIVMIAAAVFVAMGIVSCDNEELPAGQGQYPTVMKTCKLEMDIAVENYDAAGTRASVAWTDQECVYIVFNSGNNIVRGKAVYSTATADWTLHYYGTIAATTSGTCKVFNATDGAVANEAETAITLTPNSIAYSDEAATYTHSDNVIKVKATLKPKTGRLRFKGAAGTTFKLVGLKHNTSMELTGGEFTTATDTLSITIGQDGYSPYYYGSLASPKKFLSVLHEKETFYTTCNSAVLAAGKSGYMELPTNAGYNGWTKRVDQTFTVNGVTFKMIHVNAGRFTMGKQNVATPTHQVTLSDYYIGETEVTQELWMAVIGSAFDYWISGTNYPASYVSWNNCQTFISTLNELTGKQFCLPTEAQWEFAAKGGNLSEGYAYSGSNSFEEVAWTYENYTGAVHAVAMKASNELGIFDMSGNVREWCNDWYGDYSATAVTNPVGPETGTYKILRGGSYVDGAESSDTSFRSYKDHPNDRNDYYGFRIALNP